MGSHARCILRDTGWYRSNRSVDPLALGLTHRTERSRSSWGVWLLTVDLRDLLTAGGVKDENRLKLLRTIMARPGTQAYLSRRSGLSPGTVSDAVRELVAKGFALSEKDGKSRPVTIARTTGAAVGIELGF